MVIRKGHYMWRFNGKLYNSGLTREDFDNMKSTEEQSAEEQYLEAKNARIREINRANGFITDKPGLQSDYSVKEN